MLSRVGTSDNRAAVPGVRIADAALPAPFRSGLEYSSPARGTWNIVHTGMLVPEAHEIYVCGAGCLRGVVLTAAEMGLAERFSTIEVRESDLYDGSMEELITEGCADIIGRLPSRPPAVMLHTSCMHHFAGTDLDAIYSDLRARFPDIDFVDCYMDPVMRKSGLTPDQKMRSSIYRLLKERPADGMSVTVIGSDIPTRDDSDIARLLRACGLTQREIQSCRTYEEYQQLAAGRLFLSYYPDAAAGAAEAAGRLGRDHCIVKLSFDADEIDAELRRIAEALKTTFGPAVTAETIDLTLEEIIAEGRRASADALADTLALMGSTPVAIDYTYCPRPLSLARLLLDNGFNVSGVYLDSISANDRNDFELLRSGHPDLMLHPTVHAGMRFAASARRAEHAGDACGNGGSRGSGAVSMIAIGQKAAYFEDTDHFVNVVEGGGMFGYEAITTTLALMREAYLNSSDTRSLIQVKGLGCEICLR